MIKLEEIIEQEKVMQKFDASILHSWATKNGYKDADTAFKKMKVDEEYISMRCIQDRLKHIGVLLRKLEREGIEIWE